MLNKTDWAGGGCRERNEDRGEGEVGTENGMDKKPGQNAARIWLNSYCKALV